MSLCGQSGKSKKFRTLVAGGLLAAVTTIVHPQSAYPISGGNDVTDNSMGYVAQVSHVLGGFCTGSLIAQQWVLTAAHCVGGVTDPREMTVRVGTDTRTGGQVFRAVALHSYPGYQGAHNDVALLKLEFPVYGVQPVQLASSAQSFRWDGYSGGPFTQYDDGVIAGWGTSNPAGTQWPNRLQFKGVSIKPTEIDRGGWRSIPVSAGPCGGDSGGPLMVSINSQLFQVGVTKGANCASGNYSEVGQGVLRTWIIETIQNSP
ncbi:S1 family peptidase [Streptomyces sp. NPDC002454]|uniref:S1 family peptidase n=1 Tax=Streptomyces sp. NPDC002490 TaxID=3154416 RepID=UPI00333350B7